MDDWQSLSHVRWDCKYLVVFVPKYRKNALYGQLRRAGEASFGTYAGCGAWSCWKGI